MDSVKLGFLRSGRRTRKRHAVCPPPSPAFNPIKRGLSSRPEKISFTAKKTERFWPHESWVKRKRNALLPQWPLSSSGPPSGPPPLPRRSLRHQPPSPPSVSRLFPAAFFFSEVVRTRRTSLRSLPGPSRVPLPPSESLAPPRLSSPPGSGDVYPGNVLPIPRCFIPTPSPSPPCTSPLPSPQSSPAKPLPTPPCSRKPYGWNLQPRTPPDDNAPQTVLESHCFGQEC